MKNRQLWLLPILLTAAFLGGCQGEESGAKKMTEDDLKTISKGMNAYDQHRPQSSPPPASIAPPR